MTTYTKATNFATKDALLTGNPSKVVKGSEIDAEFTAIQAADATNVKSGGALGTPSSGIITNLTFDPAFTGGVNRTLNGKLEDIVSIKDFGGVGDGSTDDSAALALALASFTNDGGTIFFPAGDYILNSAVLIEPAGGRDFVSNIHFKGVGGHHTDLGTRIQLNGGTASVACMTLKSAVQMSFEDINFIGATSALALVKIQADGAIPSYSSFNIEFNRCRFAAATPVNALVWVNNCSNITFHDCFFQGAQIAVQVGSVSTDAENVGTFSTGTADTIRLIQCFLAGNVLNYRCRGLSFDSCTFDANAVLTPVGCKIYAAGQQLVRGLNIQNCWFGYGNDTETAITLGTAGYDLTAINNFFSTYEKAIRLNGVGVAHIEGNEFALNNSGAAAVDVDTATFYSANVQNNH